MRRPKSSTRTATLLPYTTLFRCRRLPPRFPRRHGASVYARTVSRDWIARRAAEGTARRDRHDDAQSAWRSLYDRDDEASARRGAVCCDDAAMGPARFYRRAGAEISDLRPAHVDRGDRADL